MTESIKELKDLLNILGDECVGECRQRLSKVHPATCIGTGKAADIALEANASGAGYIVSDRVLSHAQVRNLEVIIGQEKHFRELQGPERIALRGPNGSGKSALLLLLAGELTPQSGIIKRGSIRMSYLSQNYDSLTESQTLIQILQKCTGLTDVARLWGILEEHNFLPSLA